MSDRFQRIAALAADHHGVVSSKDLATQGVDSAACVKWQRAGLLDRLGPRSFAVAGAPPTFERDVAAALADLDGHGFAAGRCAARLRGLDNFTSDAIELLVPRQHRGCTTRGVVRSTRRPLCPTDVTFVHGLRCLTAERLILEAPLFGFSRHELENAADSAIRLRLVAEQRLRTRVIAEHRKCTNGGRMLVEAMVDTGGESRLERWFLEMLRRAGIERPVLQTTFRDGSRTVARVDACFPGGLVVEVAGHGTHATRRQRQIDAQRHTELTLRGLRVLTFTYEDVRDRPQWVIARVREALSLAA